MRPALGRVQMNFQTRPADKENKQAKPARKTNGPYGHIKKFSRTAGPI